MLYSFGACVGYAIIIADELHLCLSQLLQMRVTSDFYFLFIREFVLIVVTLFIILPIALQKKITALRYTSFFAIVGILYITIVMVAQALRIQPCELANTAKYVCESSTCVIEPNDLSATCPNLASCVKTCQGGVWDTMKSQLHAFIFSRNIFLAMPVFCYGHCSQVQFIPILSDMKKPTKTRVSVMIFLAYILIFTLYTINSLAGYMSYCGYTVRVCGRTHD